jgi:hypothetical protein
MCRTHETHRRENQKRTDAEKRLAANESDPAGETGEIDRSVYEKSELLIEEKA